MRSSLPHHLFLDFESFYDAEYSLKKMTPPQYILDPRWETIGCAVKVDEEPSMFIDGPLVGKFLSEFDPEKTTTVAFNALFDNCVAAWLYGFVPDRMYCTMQMALSLEGYRLKHGRSLHSVGEHFKLPMVKGSTIVNALGLHRTALMANPGLWRAYQAYAINDDDMNFELFIRMIQRMPQSERRLMDRVLRCAVVPRFHVDVPMLTEHLSALAAIKHHNLCDVGGIDPITATEEQLDLVAKSIRSGPKFIERLTKLGVDVEYKPSTTNPAKLIPAFAKTDAFMAGLLEHEDAEVATLASVRLGLRSTIEQTRGDRIKAIAELPWDRYHDGNKRILVGGGTLPIPLTLGPHTHRLAGTWKMNMQNLPSGRGLQNSKLRKSLVAPDGYTVVVADKSQIECRINGWLCGQQDLLEIFRNNGDPYSVLASAIFGFLVDKKIHTTERFIGKSGVLGLGFRCGVPKFYNMVVRSARLLGIDVRELLKVWTLDLAGTSVRTYRAINKQIVAMWYKLDGILRSAWLGRTLPVTLGPCVIGHGYVEGPGGLRMMYDNPHIERDDTGKEELWYEFGKIRHKMHGGVFLENIVQFLARINTMHDALRIGDRGFPFAAQAHDELVWIVPNAQVEECKRVALEEMRRAPSWAPDLPLNAECGSGRSYGDSK